MDASVIDALLFSGAHTAYRFDHADVSDATLTQVYEMARWPPTSLNIQPLRVLFLKENAKNRLLPHLDAGNRHKTQSAPVAALLCYDEDFTRHLPDLLPDMDNPMEEFPDESSVIKAAVFNSAIQAGYFILAARALGLAVGPLGGFDCQGARSELLPHGSTWAPFLVVNMGHPAPDAFRSRRPRLDPQTATAIMRS